MASTAIVRRPARTQTRNAARRELALGSPVRADIDWRGDARCALAPSRLGIDADGRITRMKGAPTGFILDPLVGGRSVYIRDEYGTRYWLGPPDRLRHIVRWLLS